VLSTQPGERGPLTVKAARPHAGGLIVCFSEVTDRDGAERLRGVLLVIDSADVAAPAGPDEFHDHQLVGLDVITVDGRRVGSVADVLHHGQDLLVVRPGGSSADTTGEVLVPFVSAIVPTVDLRAGQVVIDPPPGLLDGGEAS
jgi:16S rRNA processing protein RimM